MNNLKKQIVEMNILNGIEVPIDDMTELLKEYVKTWILDKNQIECLKLMGKNSKFMDTNKREYHMLYVHNLINIPTILNTEKEAESNTRISITDSYNMYMRKHALA